MKKFSINKLIKVSNERMSYNIDVGGIKFTFLKQRTGTDNCTSLTVLNSLNFLKKVHEGLEFNENIGSLNKILDKETGKAGKRENVYDFLSKNNFGNFEFKKETNNKDYLSDINIISVDRHMFSVIKNTQTGKFILLDSEKEPQVISREIENEKNFLDYLGKNSFVVKNSYKLEKKDFDKPVKFRVNNVLDNN